MESKSIRLRHQVSTSLWGRALLATNKAKGTERASVGWSQQLLGAGDKKKLVLSLQHSCGFKTSSNLTVLSL